MRTVLTLLFSVALVAHVALAVDDPHAGFKRTPTPETAFSYLHQVATHPRCANCHGVSDDSGHLPTVGDGRAAHPMGITSRHNVVLTVSDHGFVQVPATGMNCRSCHQDANGTQTGMPPGAANEEMPGFVWHMPLPTMAIPRDLSPAELCSRWLDPARNSSHLAQRGGRDDLDTFRAEFLEHHAKVDPLVQWAWSPGPGRTPAPGSHEDFVEAMRIWIEAGAPCPS